jgi:hypothetical protein
MAEPVTGRGPGGQGSIVFRQNLEYPREPGQITYYPPEPSEGLKSQVRKDRAGGIALYIIGFALVIIGYIAATTVENIVSVYAALIIVLLVLGTIFAVLFLYMNNLVYAKLANALPMILMFCLSLLYIVSILFAVMDLSRLGEGSNENDVERAFEGLFRSLLNPGFFLMMTGLMICRSGGTSLQMSMKVMDQFIPGMIIIETPHAGHAPAQAQAPTGEAKDRTCQHCGEPLEYVKEYGRWYCYDCQEYAPKDA